jgi:S-adenosylmethionine decarboxylase
VYQENTFHTKMVLKEIDLDDYLFGIGKDALSAAEQRKIRTQVRKEMLEMFYGRNSGEEPSDLDPGSRRCHYP